MAVIFSWFWQNIQRIYMKTILTVSTKWIQWYYIHFLPSLENHWNRKTLYWCVIQRQTDTYDNRATYSQPMHFWQIDVKIEEISVSRPSASWWYWNFFQSVMFGNESYASCILSDSKRCTGDKDTKIDFVTLYFLKLKVQKLSRISNVF